MTFTAAFQALEMGPWAVALALLEAAKRQVPAGVLELRAGDWPNLEDQNHRYHIYIYTYIHTYYIYIYTYIYIYISYMEHTGAA